MMHDRKTDIMNIVYEKADTRQFLVMFALYRFYTVFMTIFAN